MQEHYSALAKYLAECFYTDPTYRGVFVDVGAASPTLLSSSRYFYNIGWTVIRVEVLKGLTIEGYKPDIISSEDFLALNKATPLLRGHGYTLKTIVDHDYVYTRDSWK